MGSNILVPNGQALSNPSLKLKCIICSAATGTAVEKPALDPKPNPS